MRQVREKKHRANLRRESAIAHFHRQVKELRRDEGEEPGDGDEHDEDDLYIDSYLDVEPGGDLYEDDSSEGLLDDDFDDGLIVDMGHDISGVIGSSRAVQSEGADIYKYGEPARQPKDKGGAKHYKKEQFRKSRRERQAQRMRIINDIGCGSEERLPQEIFEEVSEAAEKPEIDLAIMPFIDRFREGGAGIVGLEANEILTGDYRREERLEFAKMRLKNLQQFKFSRDLVNDVVLQLADFFREHEKHIDSYAADRIVELYPHEGKADALVRHYLDLLIDWYGDVYNGRLDVDLSESRYPKLAQDGLRLYLSDGLFKCMESLDQYFDRDWSREQTWTIDAFLRNTRQVVESHLYPKQQKAA